MGHINANVLLGTDPVPEDGVDTILKQVIESREVLVERLEQLPDAAWNSPAVIVDRIAVSCGQFAEDITHHDSEILREIGHRFHASDQTRKGGR